MSVWDDMAQDAGYRGDEARQIAAAIEEQERRKAEDWCCTHCNGEGLCWDGSDPLSDCPDEPHPCHACGGSGRSEDQRIF